MVLAFGNDNDIAFMKGIVDVLGFWGLTFLCMAPMVAFTMYVWKGPIAMAVALVALSGLLLFSFLSGNAATIPTSAVGVLALPGIIGGLVGGMEFLARLQKQKA